MLEKLKEYRDVLAIVVFFLGGFFWIQGQYPTKTDLKSDIGVLSCQLDKYMSLTQLQIRGRDLERQAEELKDEIQAFGNDQERAHLVISPAMGQEIEEKKTALAALRVDLKTNATSIQTTNDELARNVCGKVTQ
jgi:predicted RNase H-like nuclease (RuvC/YqgF family)